MKHKIIWMLVLLFCVGIVVSDDLVSPRIEIDDSVWKNAYVIYNFAEKEWKSVSSVRGVPSFLKGKDYEQGIQAIVDANHEVDWDNTGREVTFEPRQLADFQKVALSDPAYKYHTRTNSIEDTGFTATQPLLSPKIDIGAVTGRNYVVQFNHDAGVWESGTNLIDGIPANLVGKNYEEGIMAIAAGRTTVDWDNTGREISFPSGRGNDFVKVALADSAYTYAQGDRSTPYTPTAPKLSKGIEIGGLSGAYVQYNFDAGVWENYAISFGNTGNTIPSYLRGKNYEEGIRAIASTGKNVDWDNEGTETKYDTTTQSRSFIQTALADANYVTSGESGKRPPESLMQTVARVQKENPDLTNEKIDELRTKGDINDDVAAELKDQLAISKTIEASEEEAKEIIAEEEAAEGDPELARIGAEAAKKLAEAEAKEKAEAGEEEADEEEDLEEDGEEAPKEKPSAKEAKTAAAVDEAKDKEFKDLDPEQRAIFGNEDNYKKWLKEQKEQVTSGKQAGKVATEIKITSVGGKFVFRDPDGNLITSNTEEEAIAKANEINRKLLKRTLQPGERAYDIVENPKGIVVKGVDGKYYTKVFQDGKIVRTAITSNTLVGQEKIGAQMVQVTYKIDPGKDPVVQAIGTFAVTQEQYNKIKKQAGANGIITRGTGLEELFVVEPDTGIPRFGIRVEKDTTKTTYYDTDIAKIFGRAVESKVITETGDAREETEFQNFFFDKEGNIVSKYEYSQLEPDERGITRPLKTFKSKVNYKGVNEDGKPKVVEITQYDVNYGFEKRDGKKQLGSVDKYVYDENGKFKEYAYIYYDDKGISHEVAFKDGKAVIPDSLSGVDDKLKKKIEGEARSGRNRAGLRRWFSAIEYSLTEFTGLSAYSSLFFDDDDLQEWRDDVDELFNNVVLGGIDYWTSEICENQYDKQVDGVAFGVTPSGLLETVAHVEAERSTPISVGASDQFFYKMTFYVRAQEDLSFNVFLQGDKSTQLFSSAIFLEEGDEYAATNERAIVQYSATFYNQICIDIEGEPLLCNDIPESDYSKDNYVKSGESSGVSSGSSGGATLTQI